MGAFVGIVFDGIAYGSLLFLISVGLSVTMGLMNFVNLAHGDVRDGGRLPLRRADPARGDAVPAHAAGRLRRRAAWPARRSSGCSTGASIAAATSIRCCSRSVSSFMAVPPRPGSGDRRSSRCSCPPSCTGRSPCSGSISAPTGCSWSRSSSRSPPALGLLLERTRFGAQLRAARRQSAGRGRRRHQRRPPVQRHVRARFGAGGAGRRARHRRAGAGSDVRAQVPGLLPAGRRGRRRRLDQGARWSRRSCSASSTSRASTTCPRSAASSSMRRWWCC